MRRLFPIVAAIGLASCSQGASKQAAENEVVTFHANLNANKLAEIYAGTDPQFKEAASADQFGKLLTAVSTKLGPVKKSSLQNWRVNFGTSGGTVTLVYDTEFAKGRGQETFLYSSGEAPKLIGYNINSNDMLVN